MVVLVVKRCLFILGFEMVDGLLVHLGGMVVGSVTRWEWAVEVGT